MFACVIRTAGGPPPGSPPPVEDGTTPCPLGRPASRGAAQAWGVRRSAIAGAAEDGRRTSSSSYAPEDPRLEGRHRSATPTPDHPATLEPVAGVARANCLDHQEARRHDVKALAGVLADVRHGAAAARAERASGLDHLRPVLDLSREAGRRSGGSVPAQRGWPINRSSANRRSSAESASETNFRDAATAGSRDDRAAFDMIAIWTESPPPGPS